MNDSDLIIITEEESSQRLDKILAQRFSSFKSRSYFQYLIEEGQVLLNGISVKKRTIPTTGDEVQINFILTPEIELLPEQIPLEIMYEDDHILIINKKAGMVVHPAAGNWSGTFVNALLFHCAHLKDQSGTLRPGIVHRLDKNTSGLLIAAKNSDAQQRLVELFTARKVYKEYTAISIGNPNQLRIEAPIGRHPIHRQMMCVRDEGKSAITHCRTLHCNGKLSVLSLILETGRTHQIRVHLKHLGTPVLGDDLYGNTQVNAQYGVTRQLLHANRLRFEHPITGNELEVTAPLPEEMNSWIKKISL